jgi:hypothetical protein
MFRFNRRWRTILLVIVVALAFAVLAIDWTFAERHYLEFKQQLLREGGYLPPLVPEKPWDPAALRFDNVSGQEFNYDISDIAIVLKTGQQTVDRLPAALEILPRGLDALSIIIVSDHTEMRGGWTVHDVVAPLLQDPEFGSLPLMQKYSRMQQDLKDGNKKAANSISRDALDALKNIQGLSLAYTLLPNRKWYYMVDDDTYTHYPTLLSLVRNLDNTQPHYLGRAVGGQVKFAANSTSTLLSAGAMHALFTEQPYTVRRYLRQGMSLDAESGDTILGFALAAAGVFIDEGRAVAFFHDHPNFAVIGQDRVCAPAAAFHQVRPYQMSELHRVFGDDPKPKTWLGIWHALTKGSNAAAGRNDWMVTTPIGGRYLESSRQGWRNCRTACANDLQCLAWQWEKLYYKCFLGSNLIIGRTTPDVYSGSNQDRIREWLKACPT